MSAAERRLSRIGLEFPPLVWIVLLGTLLTRTAFFMVWPFLAVILNRDFSLTASAIGSILGAAFLASALIGFYAGNLADRFGSRVAMLAACAGAVAAYGLLATASSVAGYAVGAFLAGLSRAALEAPGKSVIADQIHDQTARDLAFHVRYFFINIGGAVGPLIGLIFGLSAQQPTFWITAVAYAAFAGAVGLAYRWTPETRHPHASRHASFRAAIALLRRDHRFLWLIAAMFLSMFAYAQQESTLIQYLSAANVERGVTLVTATMVTNGLTIALFQFPLLRLLSGWGLYGRTYLGLVLFAAAFTSYAMLPVEGVVQWVVATWVLSVGEAILFPTLQLQTDRLAPDGFKGSYFGAAGLSGLGFGMGPFVGGWLLEHAGGPVTFAVTALLTGVCAVCYWLAERHPIAATSSADCPNPTAKLTRSG